MRSRPVQVVTINVWVDEFPWRPAEGLNMGNGGSRIRPRNGQPGFYGSNPVSERWREWASGHNRSADYDSSSTQVRRTWFGRLVPAALKRK